ncbi:pilus assembly protein PilC [Candidatus Falkowbacteria bacterium CG10_big_fil_rev_8_21_14_0_10_43_10]|uniref:Pilus assembly protein PilC n=1 Tax=Candidatus Falkowbacteria bacterium CG10_big_fil_rev_8_21_14_0_10_43_10 TaxID=1974567 RepID=A0A2H0V1C6_9BACT|nr:MAG: pilus assembly protein PilC [Candidatus Falkowbacteria bacterium CG10_big_fil_rev_8_21_14_0_10_43_10]
MPLFTYKAKDLDGNIVKGMIDGANEQLAVGTLKDQGLTVIDINEKKQMAFGGAVLNRVKPRDLVVFSRQFSVMISASIPVVQALKVLIGQTENITLKMIVSEIADEVNGGSKLSDALGERKKIFSEFYVSVVRAGESSGKLDEVLNYLADEMEKDYDMMHKIKGAMIYPIFVLAGLGAVGTIMMVWVVPKLTAVISETGGELPFATRVLMAVSGILANYWWMLLLVIIGLIAGVKYYGRTPVGRRQIDFIKIKVPIFGPLFQKIALVRFTRSLNTLIAGGVAIASSLQIAADVVGNQIYKDLILKTKEAVEGGSSISSVFLTSKEVPSMVSQMLSVGEKTGKIDIILERITDFYSREIANMVANLVTLMEPLIMVLMGLGVGAMVAAIIMPMYNMANQF